MLKGCCIFVSMIIEVLCRYNQTEDSTLKLINEALDTERIIQGDNFDEYKERNKLVKQYQAYDYGPMCINLKDVFIFSYIDNDHTAIKLYGGSAFNIKLNYTNFKNIYQTLLSTVVNSFTDIDFNEVKQKENG